MIQYNLRFYCMIEKKQSVLFIKKVMFVLSSKYFLIEKITAIAIN